VGNAEYLVFERQKVWWVLFDGHRSGPYVSRQIAIDSAVAAAKIGFSSGREARVSVQHGNDMVTAYNSSNPA
jgi:hypothetical protein